MVKARQKSPSQALVMGVDLGGTKILSAVVNGDGQILGRAKLATPAQEGEKAILEAVAGCVRQAAEAAGIQLSDIAAMGVGSPGPLDSDTGVIFYTPNLNVRDFALGPSLQKIFNCPVLVDNDVRVGGYGEFKMGAGRGLQDVVAIFVGTGIGGCIISRGQLVRGAHKNAGEIGHMIVNEGGPRCRCGARGCLEAMSSRTSMTRDIIKAIKKGRKSSLAKSLKKNGGVLRSGALSKAYAAKDPVATKVVEKAAYFLGIGAANLINIIGPEMIIFGGGVSESLGDSLVNLVRENAKPFAMADPMSRTKIQLATLGDDAGVLGASLLARERFLTA